MSPSTRPYISKQTYCVQFFTLTLLIFSLFTVSRSLAQDPTLSADTTVTTVTLAGSELQTTPVSVTVGSGKESISSAPLDSTDQGKNGDNSDLDSDQFPQEIHGIGSIFNNMLDTLSTFTTSSEYRFVTVFKTFPQIFPDLKKVFITL